MADYLVRYYRHYRHKQERKTSDILVSVAGFKTRLHCTLTSAVGYFNRKASSQWLDAKFFLDYRLRKHLRLGYQCLLSRRLVRAAILNR